jgi:hypothetical protein
MERETADEHQIFTTLLKANFQHVGNACKKIDQGSFALLDKDSHDEIDLTVDWSKVLHPGQIIRMHMVGWNLMEPALCPECETLCVTLTRRGLRWRLLEVYSFVHSVPLTFCIATRVG